LSGEDVASLEQGLLPERSTAGVAVGAVAQDRLGDLDGVADFLDGLGGRMFRPTVSRKSLLSTRAMRRFVCKEFGDLRSKSCRSRSPSSRPTSKRRMKSSSRGGIAWRRCSQARGAGRLSRRCGSATGRSSTAAS
jgi:hypothetical protein